MRIIAKAPCRVDLAGGTLDIWPLYLYHPGSVTVNFAVNLYAGCSLSTRPDKRIVLRSLDLNTQETFSSLEALRASTSYRLPLHAHLLHFFSPRTGLNIETTSEAPAGAGLAGSSTMIIALATALGKLTGAHYSKERLRATAQDIEAQIIRVPTGCQDYYPALYGGVSAIELAPGAIRRSGISVDPDELNERIVLVYTGEPRRSGINNWEVTKAHINGDRRVQRNFDQIAAIARDMRSALARADWAEAGRLLREEWDHRRKNAPGITTPLIDALVAKARRRGAMGAKVCGAGGGGCVVFLVERGAQSRVAAAAESLGAKVISVRLAPHGVRVRAVAQ
jgi:D-glycero-alpha-D-manno-heptose-7-phosphate kinase